MVNINSQLSGGITSSSEMSSHYPVMFPLDTYLTGYISGNTSSVSVLCSFTGVVRFWL